MREDKKIMKHWPPLWNKIEDQVPVPYQQVLLWESGTYQIGYMDEEGNWWTQREQIMKPKYWAPLTPPPNVQMDWLVSVECQEPMFYRRHVFPTKESAYWFYHQIIDYYFPKDFRGYRKRGAIGFTAYIRELNSGYECFHIGPMSWEGLKET